MQEEEEADPETSEDPDTSSWPSKGAVDVQKVVMRYRPNLPAVLRSVTFSVRPPACCCRCTSVPYWRKF